MRLVRTAVLGASLVLLAGSGCDAVRPQARTTPTTAALPRLVVSGQVLRLETGERWTWIGASEFNLLNRFRHGEDIEPILTQLQSAGFNAVRVFTVYDVCASGRGCQAIGRSEPTPDLYASIVGFSRALAKHGLYAELVGFTGPYDLLQSDDAKVRHWHALIGAVQGLSNITLELVNEYDHPANRGLPMERLPKPTGVLASHGSATQGQMPLMPTWDYATYHPGAGPEWVRKVGYDAMLEVADRVNVPTVVNETTRFPDNAASAAHAFDAAAGAALLTAGAVFHSVSGKAAVPWKGGEFEAAKAWANGARSVPLTCQGETFKQSDSTTFVGVYARGADAACVVRIRR